MYIIGFPFYPMDQNCSIILPSWYIRLSYTTSQCDKFYNPISSGTILTESMSVLIYFTSRYGQPTLSGVHKTFKIAARNSWCNSFLDCKQKPSIKIIIKGNATFWILYQIELVISVCLQAYMLVTSKSVLTFFYFLLH